MAKGFFVREARQVFRRNFPVGFALTLLAALFVGDAMLGQQPVPAGPLTRTCDPNADALKSKKKPSKKNPSKSFSGAACLDVRENALAVQEHLQKFVREQRWDIGEEQMSEDTWTFARYLKKTEVGEYTQPWTGTAIEWRSAKALITVRTTEIPDGYTRTLVTTRIEGYGEQEDQFATKRESWSLQSNGTLESVLTAVLTK